MSNTTGPAPAPLPAPRHVAVSPSYSIHLKQTWLAYLLWFFLGVFGGHQFYLGKWGRAISMLLTFGWFGVGVLVDLFTLPAQTRVVNTRIRVESGLTNVPPNVTTVYVQAPPQQQQPAPAPAPGSPPADNPLVTAGNPPTASDNPLATSGDEPAAS